jgi:ATP-dependent Clp protease adaptor protein ClpS
MAADFPLPIHRTIYMANADPRIQTDIQIDLKPPSLFRVIYLNDDVTSIDFVIDSLMNYFNYSEQDAEKVTTDIHEQGSAVVAVLPFELAEQKGIEITMSAREQKYPLQIKLEPETR